MTDDGKRPLRVAIYAEVAELGRNGGLEGAIAGLVRALGRLEVSLTRYTVIVPRDHPEWLDAHLGPSQSTVVRPSRRPSLGARIKHRIRRRGVATESHVRRSNGFYESLDCDVLHWPYQHYEVTDIPSVYTPHDAQHVHLPEFFSEDEIARREEIYAAGCSLSRAVTTGSEWIKNDLVEHYGIPPDKVHVIPWAPATTLFDDPAEPDARVVLARYGLTPGFVLYPAVTWPHKNHVRLLEAVAKVRERHGVTIDLLCTGWQSPYFSHIRDVQESLGLEENVRFLGVVPGSDLRALYRAASFVIVPTLFEAASGPMFEAWQEGTPVAASTVTSLPEQAHDAAFLFDPYSVEAIAAALWKLHSDESLRNDLAARGSRRLAGFSWEQTARGYLEVYRRVADGSSSERRRRR